MKLFDSEICRCRAHCAICRARNEKGAARRAVWAVQYEDVPDTDFDCPHGVPWDTRRRRPRGVRRGKVVEIPADIRDIKTVEEMEDAIRKLPEETARIGMAKLLHVLTDKAISKCCGGKKPLAIMRVWLTENRNG